MGTSKNLVINSIIDAMSTVSATSINLIGADGHHLLSFCVRFSDRNHLVDRLYVEPRTGLLRVALTVRCDRSCSFEVYAAELPLDALETIQCVFGQMIVASLQSLASGAALPEPENPFQDAEVED